MGIAEASARQSTTRDGTSGERRIAECTSRLWHAGGPAARHRASDHTAAEMTWMLDRNTVRTALDRLRREKLERKPRLTLKSTHCRAARAAGSDCAIDLKPSPAS